MSSITSCSSEVVCDYLFHGPAVSAQITNVWQNFCERMWSKAFLLENLSYKSSIINTNSDTLNNMIKYFWHYLKKKYIGKK